MIGMRHGASIPASTGRAGFTLAEAAISTVIVAVMTVAALTCVAQTGTFRRASNEQQMASLLAEQFMSEILSKSYSEPSASSPTGIGPAASELSTGDRSLFNDVDDYHGWTESPARTAGGVVLANTGGWYRTVRIAFVHWQDLQTPTATDYGLKRISVEVGRLRSGGQVTNESDRRPITTLVAIAGRGRGL